MKRILLMCLVIFCSGCTVSHIAEQIMIDAEQAECREREDIHDVVTWVNSLTGVPSPLQCHRVHDVLIHVQVGTVAILLVDIEMPMAEWWHLNDVMMAEGFDSFLLSWRDVEMLGEIPYYEKKLRKLLDN